MTTTIPTPAPTTRASLRYSVERANSGEWRVTINGVVRCIAFDAGQREWYVSSGNNLWMALGARRRDAVRRLLAFAAAGVA